MPASMLFSSASILQLLPFLNQVYSQTIPGATFFNGNGAAGAGDYQLIDDYEPSIFFNRFNFYSSYDPTYGHVQYVDEQVAVQNGFVTVSNDTAVISVDTTNKWPRGGSGRPSVRLISDNTYTHGLFILDVVHMPAGCGTWPAYWLLGPTWPNNGEIDIIEGVNTIAENTITMHTSDNCTIEGSGQTATFDSSNCYVQVDDSGGCGSSLSTTLTPNNYGAGLNANGGGVYATEWTSDYVKHWFFSRQSIPDDITSGSPDPSQWSEPAVNAQGSGCTIDQHFNNMSIIINTDFCGAWAGEVYSQYTNCPQNASAGSSLNSCVDFVGNNPSYFTDAYWEINSIKVYQMPPGVEPSTPYSTSLSSVAPAATGSTSTINVGMGQSTTSLSSLSYTGPLSVITTSTSASTATATPAICPATNNTEWTDASGEQYIIACGSDYNGGADGLPGGGVVSATSFDGCLDTCDVTQGCLAVSYVGGNGAGICYMKSTSGVFVYDGSTDSASRNAGPAVYSSALITSSSSIVSSTSAAGDEETSRSGSATTPPISSSTAADVQSTASMLPCPDANGTIIIDDNGDSYQIYCSSDTSGSDSFSSEGFDDGDYSQCADACDLIAGCGAWVWVADSSTGSGGTCSYKSLPQDPITGTDNEIAGIQYTDSPSSTLASTTYSISSTPPTSAPLDYRTSATTSSGVPSLMPSTSSKSALATSTTLSCPSINNTFYTDISGISYTLLCGAETNAGVDSTQIVTGDFTACFVLCEDKSNCVGFTFSPYVGQGTGICYFKVQRGSSLVQAASDDVAAELATSTSSSSSSFSTSSSMMTSSSMALASSTSTLGSSGSASSSGSSATSSSTTSSASSTFSSLTNPMMMPTSTSSSLDSVTISFTTSATATSSSSGSSSLSLTAVSSTSSSEASAPPCNTTFTDPSGKTYSIMCSTDSSEQSFRTIAVSSGGYSSCYGYCDNTIGCNGFVYYGGDFGNCYLKQQPGTFSEASYLITSVFLLSVLPRSSSSILVSSSPGLSSSMIVSSTLSSTMSGYGTLSSTQVELAGTQISSTMSSMSTVSPAGPAPPCPTSTESYCDGSASVTTCSSESGQNYDVQCNVEYEGTVIDTSDIDNLDKRALEPDLSSCQSLCDTTPGCLALDYEGKNCTLLSSVTGTSYAPGIVGAQIAPSSSAPSSAAASATPSSSPSCPGFAGRAFTDREGVSYNIVCYTDYAGGNIGEPFSASSFANCLPSCDSTTGCVGVEFSAPYSLCWLKSSFAGVQTGNTSIIAGLVTGAPGGYQASTSSSIIPGSTTSRPIPMSATVAASSGGIVTVINTVTTYAPTTGYFTSNPSGSFYVYTSASGSFTPSPNASLCYTCALTPTVVTGGSSIPSSSGIAPTSMFMANPTCSIQYAPGARTSTVFTTNTITSCGPQPTCPAPGYIIWGGGASQSGQEIITTINSGGRTITYTQVPTGSLATNTIYSSITASSSQTGSTVVPTCPASDHSLYTDSMGMQYEIYCNTLITSEMVKTQTQTSLTACIAACDMFNTMTFYLPSQCMGVSWLGGTNSGNCLLKGSIASVAYQEGVISALLRTPYAGPGGGNGTGSGGGGIGTTIIGTMTASPILMPTTYLTGGSTIVTVSGGQTITYISGASTVVATMTKSGGYGGGSGGGGTTVTEPGGGSGSGGSGGSGGDITVTGPGGYGGEGVTYYSTYATLGPATTVAEVSTYVSNGETVLSTYGYSTIPGTIIYATITLVSTTTATTTTTAISYVPSTVYAVSTAVSTAVSNGQTILSTYGVTTAISISYIPAPTQTVTTTTLSVSIVPETIYSVSEAVSTYISNGVIYRTSYGVTTAISVSYAPASTITTTTVSLSVSVSVSVQPTTVSGAGGGNGTTVTQTVTTTVLPVSSSSSFTCRTYATNYLNGLHGRGLPMATATAVPEVGMKKRKRSVLDFDGVR